MMPAVTPAVVATFYEYFQGGTDPFDHRSRILTNFDPAAPAGGNAVGPAALRAIAESTTHVLAFLGCDVFNMPIVLLMPFTCGLAGDPNQEKYFLTGDVTPEGQLPTISKMPPDFFHQALTAGATTNNNNN